MIRLLQEKDESLMFQWMQDDEIVENFQTDFKSFSLEKIKNFIKSSAEQTMESATLNYAIVDSEDNYMGTVSLKNINRVDLNAEYAIVTRKEAHGKGYAKAATDAILQVAFEELNLERVYLYASVYNIAANKFYKKYGFHEEGVFRKHVRIQGELVDICWYSILKEEYKEQKRKNA